jgi:hypothetical protein
MFGNKLAVSGIIGLMESPILVPNRLSAVVS